MNDLTSKKQILLGITQTAGTKCVPSANIEKRSTLLYGCLCSRVTRYATTCVVQRKILTRFQNDIAADGEKLNMENKGILG